MSRSIICSLTQPITPADVQPLLAQTDWANTRTPEQLQHLLAHSVCAGAWDGERLVGFARAVTDDLFRAFVEDVVVDEAYRAQGVGAALMGVLLKRLEHVQEIALTCIEARAAFYERLGFTRHTQPCMRRWQG